MNFLTKKFSSLSGFIPCKKEDVNTTQRHFHCINLRYDNDIHIIALPQIPSHISNVIIHQIKIYFRWKQNESWNFEWAQNTWSELNKQESYDILCGYMTSLWQIFTRCSYLKLFGLIQKNPDNQKSRIGKIICLSYIREGFFYNAHHINRNKRIVTCKRRSRFPCRRNQKLQTDRISILLLVALFCLCGRKEH